MESKLEKLEELINNSPNYSESLRTYLFSVYYDLIGTPKCDWKKFDAIFKKYLFNRFCKKSPSYRGERLIAGIS